MNYQGLIVTDALDMGALGGVPKIQESALQALIAGSNLLCFSGLGDQSQIVAPSLIRIKEAIVSGELSEEVLDFSANKVRTFTSEVVSAKKSDDNLDFHKLVEGFEISGSIRVSNSGINLIEIGTKPTIAAWEWRL